MFGIDRNVPVRVALERVPAGGNRTGIVGTAIEGAHRIDAALVCNQERTGHARRTPCLVAHPSRLFVRRRDPPSERRLLFDRERFLDEGRDAQDFRRRYDNAHVAAIAAPLAAGGPSIARRRAGVTKRDQRIYRGADLGSVDPGDEFRVDAGACGFGELVPSSPP